MKELFIQLLKTFSLKYFKRFKILLEKPRLLLFVLLNLYIISRILYPFNFLVHLTYTLVLFAIAMSDWLESLMRKLEDVRRVATSTEKERLFPIFGDILKIERVKDTIKPYIIDTASINAMAIGRGTIAINRGLLNYMNDEELKGIIAHELGHINNGDTIINNVITVYTFFYFGTFYILRFLITWLANTFASSFIGEIFTFAKRLLDFAFNAVFWLCTLIIAGTNRRQEYNADQYAQSMGYGQGLLSALYKIYEMEISDKKGLIERFKTVHPKTAYRIEKLEKNNNTQ